LLHADGRTDRELVKRKLIAAFRNFANAPKKGMPCVQTVTF